MISDHQRDLVGSSIARDFPTIVVNVVQQLNTLLRGPDGVPFISRISVDEENCKKNQGTQGKIILAEPVYIALQMAGFEGDAHELVNHHALRFVESGDSWIEAVKKAMVETDQAESLGVIGNIPPETLEILKSPEHYVGDAAEKANQIASIADTYLKQVVL